MKDTEGDIVLESWVFSPQEWNLFVAYERKNKISDNIYYALAIILVGVPFLMFTEEASFYVVISIVFPFAVVSAWLRAVVLNKYLKMTKQEVSVEFRVNYLKIGSVKVDLIKHNKWLKNIEIIESKNGMKLLEFVIEWKTIKGNTNDETRIPIPPDEGIRALELVSIYRNKSGITTQNN